MEKQNIKTAKDLLTFIQETQDTKNCIIGKLIKSTIITGLLSDLKGKVSILHIEILKQRIYEAKTLFECLEIIKRHEIAATILTENGLKNIDKTINTLIKLTNLKPL